MEKFCLQHDAFQKNTMKEIQELRQNQHLSDVTLVLEDGSIIPAHKMILAMSSSFFNEILTKSGNKNNNCNNLSIFMRKCQRETIVQLLDFIYNGEVTVEENNIQGFIELAQELKIKGLQDDLKTKLIETGSLNTDSFLDLAQGLKTKRQQDRLETAATVAAGNSNRFRRMMKKEVTADELAAGTFVTSDDQISELDLLISSKMERTPQQKRRSLSSQKKSVEDPERTKTEETRAGLLAKSARNEWRCKECGKCGMKVGLILKFTILNYLSYDSQFQFGWHCNCLEKANIVTHVEGRHVSGFLHPCFMCGVSFR